MNRRETMAALLVLVAAAGPLASFAEDFPAKTVRMITAFEAGGTVDVIGRVVANQINKASAMRIVADNKPGANSAIGAMEVARAAPDGYTVLNISPSIVLNPLLSKSIAYDLYRDFAPVTILGVGSGYLLVVREGLPAKNLNELVALARKSESAKTELTYGTPGVGNALHLASESFAAKAGVRLLHIPYKGSAGALAAIAAGQVDLMVLSPATIAPYLKAGKIRLIAFTGNARSPEYPEVPTMAEAGVPDFVMRGTWVGWFVPAKTPPQVVARLAEEVRKDERDPEVTAKLTGGGFEPDGRPPAETLRFVRTESQRYSDVLRSAKIELQ